MLVGGLVLTLAAGVVRTTTAPDRYAEALGHRYDVSLEQFSGRPRTAEVAALPSVVAAESVTFVFGGLFGGEADVPVEGLMFAGAPEGIGARVVEGRSARPSRSDEFVATWSWVEASGAQLGDEYVARTITQTQADERGFDVDEPGGPTVVATLVGIIDGPSELEEAYPIAVFSPALLDMGGPGDVGVSASAGLVALRDGATADDLREELDGLDDGDVFGVGRAELVPVGVRDATETQGRALLVVAVIVGLAALAVLGQLATRFADQPASQRRTERAIGLSPRQLLIGPAMTAAVPLIAGAIGAGFVAFLASGLFPVGFVERLEPEPGLRFDPRFHLAGGPLLGALVLAWIVVSLSLGRRQAGSTRVSTPSARFSGVLGSGRAVTGVRFALARHPRDPGSARAPLVGLVVVLAVLIGAVTFGASLGRFLDEPALRGAGYDFATGAGSDRVPPELRAMLDTDPDIADVTLSGTTLAHVGSVALDLTGMEQVRGDLSPDLLEGDLPRSDDELALGRSAARDLEVEVGEEITLVGQDGRGTYLVSGLVVMPSVEGGDGLGQGGLVTLEGLRRIEPDAELGVALVRNRVGASGVEERIRDATGITVGPMDLPAEVINLDRVRSTPFLVAASLAVLAVLSMGHQLLTSARRRRRDLAVFRTLGAERGWVSGVLHSQVTALAAAGALVALPLGVASGRLVYRMFIERIGALPDASVPYGQLGVGFVLLLIAGNAIAAFPARRARLDRPGRVLADE